MGSCERGVYTMPIVQACAQRVSAQCLVHSAEVDCGLFVPGVHRTARARALVCVCVCASHTLVFHDDSNMYQVSMQGEEAGSSVFL